MRKFILSGLVLNSFLFADCNQVEQLKSAKIFADSRDEKNIDKRLDLILKAQEICALPEVEIEIEKLLIEAKIDSNLFDGLEDRLSKLSQDNDRLDSHLYVLKFNNKREIHGLFTRLYTKQKALSHKKGFRLSGSAIKNVDTKLARVTRKLDTGDKKSLTEIGGLYKSDLRFDVNKSVIRNKSEANALKKVIQEIVLENPSAVFTVTGYASSEGKKRDNYILSVNRAKSFADFMGMGKQIKTFAKGESVLVCTNGLLPEADENGEFRCTSAEDRDASRRVQIRRVK